MAIISTAYTSASAVCVYIHPTLQCLPLAGIHTLGNLLALQSMTIEEAEEKLLTILKQVMEEKLTSSNVEVRDCYNPLPNKPSHHHSN